MRFGFLLSTLMFLFNQLAAQVMSTREYIDAYKFAAMQEMKIFGIPASITLGQGILESASGNSKLARECNNHFGIKCRKNWTGTFCLADDDAANECFRGYPSAMESYRDHSLFLKNGSRYASLFSYPVTDYKSWAGGLRTAGYATNPAYASTLIGVIEKYRLGMYDSMVLLGDDYYSPDTAAGRLMLVHGLPAVAAGSGQTPEHIARQHDMGAWQIYKYNDLKRGESLNPGEIVYLKPKRRKGDVETHTIKEGETLRSVSQEHAVKLKQVYRRNRLKPGQQVRPGEVIYLQKKRELPPALEQSGQEKTEVAPVVSPSVKTDQPVKVENEAPLNPNFHEVQPGETLYSIARKRSVSVADLRKWNNLDTALLKPGQLLVLKSGVKSAPADSLRHSNGKADIDMSVTFHTVIAGETLFSIARLYNARTDSLISWNNLNGASIRPGQELRVKPPIRKNDRMVPKTYTVQPGETLFQISRRFGVSVDALKLANGLAGSDIRPGQVLSIPQP